MTELADKIEAAEASEQRAVLTEAFFALFPSPPYEPDWNCEGNAFAVWQDKEIAFKRMLDAEAYESASMTLVPEGWAAKIWRYPNGRGIAMLSEWSRPYRKAKVIGAATPALALCAAALRAKEEPMQDEVERIEAVDRWQVETRFTDDTVQTLSFPFEHEARAYHGAVWMARECVLSKLKRQEQTP